MHAGGVQSWPVHAAVLENGSTSAQQLQPLGCRGPGSGMKMLPISRGHDEILRRDEPGRTRKIDFIGVYRRASCCVATR